VNEERRTLLLDEADGLDISVKALRSILNANRKGRVAQRVVQGRAKRYSAFGPIALASIGSLHLPLMSRSIVIRMGRHDGVRSLRRFDLADTDDLDVVYAHIRHWASNAVLALDPDMPVGYHGRDGDNWRPLLAIADACGPAWSALAREATTAFSRADRDEDVAITLLHHAREVFEARAVDRIASKEMVKALIELDGADAMWAEFRGASGDGRPRKLTQNALAALLRPFGVRPRTAWPLGRTATTKSFRGYFRSDFEAAWRSYCDEGATPSQPRSIRHLRSA
jgi:hypothetical protein